MAEFTFILLGALTFALTGSLFLVFWTVVLWIFIRELRVLYRAHKLKKARMEIRDRERARIAKMIRDKKNEEEWLKFIAQLDKVELEEPYDCGGSCNLGQDFKRQCGPPWCASNPFRP